MPVNAIARIANEEMVVTGSVDGSIRIWSIKDGQLVLSIETGLFGSQFAKVKSTRLVKAKVNDSDVFVGDPISAIATSHDSRLIIYGTNDGMIYAYDLWTNQSGYLILPGSDSLPRQVLWKLKGKISKEYDDQLEKMGELSAEELEITYNIEEYYRAFKTHNVGKIKSLAISEDSRVFASTGEKDGAIKLWDMKSKQLLHFYEYSQPMTLTKVHALTINSNNKRIIAVSDGEVDESGKIWQWDMESGSLISSIELPSKLSASVISNDRNYVVSAFVNGILCITDVRNGRTVPLYGKDTSIRSLAISSDYCQIFCGYEDGRVEVFQLNNLDTAT